MSEESINDKINLLVGRINELEDKLFQQSLEIKEIQEVLEK